jgi:membrane protein YdbS with pleckstrin-like domain
MFCDRCGAENKDTAAFCRKCGEAVDGAEIETRVASRPPGYAAPAAAAPVERVESETAEGSPLFDIRPTLIFVKAGYVATAISAVLLVAILAALTVPTIYAIFVGLLLFLVPAYFHVQQKLLRYKLTETSLEIDSGLIATNTQNIPLRRIQDVTVSATALQRLTGLGDIVIDNASEDGGKVALHHIDRPRIYADMLLKQMAQLDK